MKNKPWFAVVYMFVVTAFFSSIVIGFAAFTKDRVEANKQIAFERSVLEVFDLAKGVAAGNIHSVFVEKIKEPDEKSGGAYLYVEDGETKGYAVPISGKGFWAPIKGIIGVSADKKTVTGISFYEQNETPGLGAEIEQLDFRSQFEGKLLGEGDEVFGIVPLGTELADNQVNAISGATQTCTRLELIINENISMWRQQIAGEEVEK